MKKYKSLLLAVIGLLCSISVSAHDFEVDGIYYNITSAEDKTVEITYRGSSYNEYSNEYSGSVTIPETVTYNDNTYSATSIGDWAFGYCSRLTSVEIPNSVTSIGDKAFFSCSSLTSVEIPDSVSSIGYMAFDYCSSLTSVQIPNSVTSIGDYAFSGCSSLTSVVIGNGVTSIGSSAFSGCLGLTSVQIPNSVTSIDYNAFSGCSSLTSVEIPNSVTSIGGYAFYECSSLTSVVIPNSVTSIGEAAFGGCFGLTSIVVAEDNSRYDSRDNCNAIIKTQTNTLIAGCSETTIPNSVTSIGDYAFHNCSSLTSVEIPNSVTSIGEAAFRDCSSLTSVEIPNSVTSIGDWAFGVCSSLTSIAVAEGNPTYDSRDNCNAIIETQTNTLIAGCSETTIPNSVTSIGDYAFVECSGLTSVQIPNSVTSIGDWAFGGCSSLTSVEIPNSMTHIGEWAFFGCSGLTSVEIPNSVTSIWDYAFEGCSDLTSITSHIPANNLFPIKSNVFESVDKSNCTLNVPYGAKEKYESTAGWSEFENIVELNKVESIHVDEQGVRYELNVINETFMAIGYTDYLSTDIVLPATIDGVTMSGIASEAFKNAEIQTLVIPATIQEVGDDAFVGCTELRWVDWQTQAQARAECFDAPEVHGNMLLFCYGEQAPDYAGNVVVNGKAKKIVLMDARPYASPYDYEAENISFTKTFTKETMIGTGAGWEGIVVPFDVERIVFGDKVIAPFGATRQYCDIPCWLAQMKDENFMMTDAIKADEAYIMAVPNSEAYDDDYNVEGDVRFEATNAVVKATANSATAPANEHALVGTYEPVEIDADVFALNDDGYWNEYEGLMAPGSIFVHGLREVRPFEAYVRSTKALQMACLKIGSVLPTHITSVQSGKTDAEAWYTLQGKRLNTKPVQTGFYLHGGKLEFVRQQ